MRRTPLTTKQRKAKKPRSTAGQQADEAKTRKRAKPEPGSPSKSRSKSPRAPSAAVEVPQADLDTPAPLEQAGMRPDTREESAAFERVCPSRSTPPPDNAWSLFAAGPPCRREDSSTWPESGVACLSCFHVGRCQLAGIEVKLPDDDRTDLPGPEVAGDDDSSWTDGDTAAGVAGSPPPEPASALPVANGGVPGDDGVPDLSPPPPMVLPLPAALRDRPGRRSLGQIDIDVAKIVVCEEIRTRPVNEAYATALANAIAAGATTPPLVIDVDHVLVDGAHRLLAAMILRKKRVSAAVFDYATPAARLVHAAELNSGSGRQYTARERRRLGRRLVKAGMEIEEIALVLGVTGRAVRGWTRESRAERSRALRQQIERLHGQGETQEAIARHVGISRDQVRGVIERMGKDSGIPKRPSRRLVLNPEPTVGEQAIRAIADGLIFQLGRAAAVIQGAALWPTARKNLEPTLTEVIDRFGIFMEVCFAEGFFAPKSPAEAPGTGVSAEGDSDRLGDPGDLDDDGDLVDDGDLGEEP